MNNTSMNLDNINIDVDEEGINETANELDKIEKRSLEAFAGVHETVEKAREEIKNIKQQLKEKRHSEYQELATEYWQTKENLDMLPEKIRDQKDHISGLNETVKTKKEELDLLESTMSLEINNATDEDGKKKFSNKGMRQAELKRRMKKSDEYQEAKEDLEDAKRAKEQAEFELDRLYNQWKAVRKKADMLSSRMEMLAGI